VAGRQCKARDYVTLLDWKTVLRIKGVKYEVNGTMTDADMDNECYCQHDGYEKTHDWDEPGGDLQCDGRPFCRVCGGLRGARAACNPNPRCVGFVSERRHGGRYFWYNCSYLKASMRPAAERKSDPWRPGKPPNGWDTFAKAFH
jgi:hypothetical protein